MNQNFYQLTKINNNNEYDKDEDDIENNIEDDNTHLLNDENEEFVEFKNNVKEWLTLDDDIITLQKQ